MKGSKYWLILFLIITTVNAEILTSSGTSNFDQNNPAEFKIIIPENTQITNAKLHLWTQPYQTYIQIQPEDAEQAINVDDNGNLVISGLHIGKGEGINCDAGGGDEILKLSSCGNEIKIGTDSNILDFMRIRPTKGKGIGITGNNDQIGVFIENETSKVGIGTSNPQTKLDVSGNVKANSFEVEGKDDLDTLPTGTILMYDGSGIEGIATRTLQIGDYDGDTVSMPGWYVCNGKSGTPNLMGRFIVGADPNHEQTDTNTPMNPEDTGGNNNAIVVEHTHTGTTDTRGEHHHRWWGSNDMRKSSCGDTCHYMDGRRDSGRGWHDTNNAGSHSHSFTTDSTGEPETDKNMPSYYAVVYIIKMS